MTIDNFTYTRLGFRNGLFSLIPVFPIFSLFPGVPFADQVGKIANDCELGYTITLWTCLTTVVAAIVVFVRRENFHRIHSAKEHIETRFNILCAVFYILVNTALLVIFLGTNLASHGDGQSALVCIYTGPLTSFGIILLGILLDMSVRSTAPDKSYTSLPDDESLNTPLSPDDSNFK